MIGIEGAAGEYAAQRLRVCPGTMSDPRFTASIPTGLPPRSGTPSHLLAAVRHLLLDVNWSRME